MGGRLTSHLNSKERSYISEHVAEILHDLTPLYQRHYGSNLLSHLRNKHLEPTTKPHPLIQQSVRKDLDLKGVVTRTGIMLEGTLPQYLDGIWTHRHLQVTSSFAVESRGTREVFEGGWGCKTEIVLSGCQICTSIHEHRELVDDMCRHVTGKAGGKLACWDCPTAFPVFIQHPYTSPVCLATASSQEQTQWANTLRAATQHQSSVLWRDGSPESRTFLDAVSSLQKLRGNSKPVVHPMGNEEEVLVGLVMEEILSCLKKEVFPRITAHRSRRRKTWIRVLSEVYRMVNQQVKDAMAVLKEEWSLYHCNVEKQISEKLQQATSLQDHIARMITEDTCELMLQSLLHTILPRLHHTLLEVAKPICNGFASTWRYFLKTCDDIIELGSINTSVKNIKKEILTPLSGLGPDDARMWKCLDRLELGSECRAWLQDTWGVRSKIWRPLILKAQNALYQAVDMYAGMFSRLVSRYPCFSSDSSQLTAMLCRVRDRVVKHLEAELLALRSHLILEMILHVTLPAFEQGVNEQDLSCYNAIIKSEQALFIQPESIFDSILRDNLTLYIQSVMRYSLPEQFVPLPVSPNSPCSSSSGVSESVHHKLLPHGDCQQKSTQTCEGFSSESETLTPSTESDCEDTLADSENLEKHMLALLDVGEYIHLTEP